MHHRRTKHIELDIHFVREKVAIGEVRVMHIPSARQIADVFTKGLPSALFFDSGTASPLRTATLRLGGVSTETHQQRLAPALGRPRLDDL